MTRTEIIVIAIVVVVVLVALIARGSGPRVTEVTRTVRREEDDTPEDRGNA